MNTPRSRPLRRYPDSVKRKRPANKKPNHWIGGIADQKLAEALGHIVSQWAHVEELMINMLALLLGEGGDHAARQVFRSVNSTQARIKIMRVLLEESMLNKDKERIFDEIIDEFSSLTKERNNYAHGLWWTDAAHKISRSDPTDSNYSCAVYAKPASIEEAQLVLSRIQKLSSKITIQVLGTRLRREALRAKPPR